MLNMITNVVACAVGIFFMVMAFIATSVGPAFSFGRGPRRPLTMVGRIIIFAAGFLVFVDGLRRLLR
jgi:hypothetical protein